MRKHSLLALALLAATLCPGAYAESRPTEIEFNEAVALELEQLFMQLAGTTPESPVVRRHGKNLYSMSVEPTPEQAPATTASQFRMMAVGQQESAPSGPRFLQNAALKSTSSILNFWWAVYNGSDTDRVASTRLTVRGAGRVFLARTEDLSYPAGKITIYWEGRNESLEKAGFYTLKTKVTGAGSRKTSFMAE